MTIQEIKLGTAPAGTGGDTLRQAYVKVNNNFSTNTHAASRMVGDSSGNIPEITGSYGINATGWAGKNAQPLNKSTNKVDDFQQRETGVYAIDSDYWGNGDIPHNGHYLMMQLNKVQSRKDGVQILLPRWSNLAQPRMFTRSCNESSFSDWMEIYHSKANIIYNTTTAVSPNVVVTSTGELRRSTSTRRLKTNVNPLVMDDQLYKEFLQLVPIFYQSTAEADNPNYWYQSFDADAIGEKHPSLVGWEDAETVLDEETGEYVERKLDKRRAIGLNLNGIVAVIQSGVLYQAKLIEQQDKTIKALTKRIEALEAKS